MQCPVCEVEAGNWHRADCGWEQCPYCGAHLVGCGCKRPPLDDRIRWSGFCPWVEACEEFGFFEKKVHGKWIPCHGEALFALPDIRRLLDECDWDRARQRFVSRRRAAA
jgi:hypothetical protein